MSISAGDQEIRRAEVGDLSAETMAIAGRDIRLIPF
jgi:hypothetical protein